MNKPIHDNQINRILLKPRFNIKRSENKEVILKKFENNFSNLEGKFRGKIIDHHIIIDVAKEEEHFWSPQLQLEIEKAEENTTMIKGLFGPKPQVWTLFMFIHFGVALAFFIFITMLYSRWSLKQDYTFPLSMSIALPILWIVLYFLGQIGKKKGYKQMVELDDFMKKVLEK